MIPAIYRKLFRDLWHMRGQALAVAMVITGGVATWITFYSTLDSLTLTQQAFYRENRFAEVFANLKRAPRNLAERIAEIPGVDRVEPRTVAMASLEVEGYHDPITSHIVSLPDSAEADLNRPYLRAGRLPLPHAATEVLVGEPFAEAHRLRPGDRIVAIINGRRETLTISGIALSPEYIVQIRPGDVFPDYERYGILWMREAPLAAGWQMTNAFNSVALTLRGGASAEEVIDRLDNLLEPYGGTGAYGRDLQMSHSYLENELSELRNIGGIVPILFLGVAAFLINIVITRIVEQQRDQIAILKAFGYSNRMVGLHYMLLVLLIVLLGAVPGLLLGNGFGHGMAGIYSEFFRFPYLHYHLSVAVALSGIAVAAAAAGLGALHALRTAVKLPPAEAMRPEPPATYRPTVVERMGAQRWFDQPSRMILRHIERRPFRALLSVLGIALAGGILLVGMFQDDAITYMVEVQYGVGMREDLTVTFTEPASRLALHELAALPGVLRAEPFRIVPVELRAGHRSYRTVIQALEPEADLHRALSQQHRPIAMPPDGVLLTPFIADKLGVKAGDWLEVEVREGARPVRRVPVAEVVHQFIGNSGYMALPALNRLMREGERISGAYLAVDELQRQAVMDRLKGRPRIIGTTIREVAIQSFYESFGETLLIMAGINVLLAGSIAFGVIYNSARIALSVHGRELASLRVLGFTKGEIAYILLGELAVLTLMAMPLALGIGYWFCKLIVDSLDQELFTVPLVIHASSYGFVLLVMAVAALISALMVRHRLYRLDMIAVLKTRE